MRKKTLGSLDLLLITIVLTSSLTLISCSNTKSTSEQKTINATNTTTTEIALERLGINGEYDRSGLAKRVLAALENIPKFRESAQVYVAQQGRTIILKGTVPNRAFLTRLIAVAEDVNGVEKVNSEQVSVR
jgi:osmotically-inducible protein OsmY